MERVEGQDSGCSRRRLGTRGQTETIGVVLMLGMTLVGASLVVTFGAQGLQDVQDASQFKGTEQAMTQFDSRAAIVGLGETDTQRVQLGNSGDGHYAVDDGAGWVNISHYNHSGSGQVETFINTSLGAVTYENGDTIIAYQGGGVWRTSGDNTTMVSPPEFHYRAATLTFPIIRVNGSGGAAGRVTTLVSVEERSHRAFPNGSASYPDGSSYANPIDKGNVTVTIHSDYYQAWAEYFRTRTDGEVTTYHNNDTVSVNLLSKGTVGEFNMPKEGNSLSVRSIGEEHATNNFTVTLAADNSGNNFQNLHWAFYAEEGGEEFEIHFHSPDKCKGGSYNGEIDMSIYYYNGTTGYYQGWQNSSIDPDTSPHFDVDCSDYTLTANLTGDTPLEYKAIDITGSDNKWYYGDHINSYSVVSELTVDEHPSDPGTTFDAGTGDTAELGLLINHYFAILSPSFELSVTDGPGGSSRIDEDGSSGNLDYDQGDSGKYITFLHITENEIRVEFE